MHPREEIGALPALALLTGVILERLTLRKFVFDVGEVLYCFMFIFLQGLVL